jgi:hypothetical protein
MYAECKEMFFFDLFDQGSPNVIKDITERVYGVAELFDIFEGWTSALIRMIFI